MDRLSQRFSSWLVGFVAIVLMLLGLAVPSVASGSQLVDGPSFQDVSPIVFKHRNANGLVVLASFNNSDSPFSYTVRSGGVQTIVTYDADDLDDEGEGEEEPQFGDLKVSNTLKGPAFILSNPLDFVVTLDDPSINGTYGASASGTGGMTFENGVARFELSGGRSLVATGLPAGITFTVEELEANKMGYDTTVAVDGTEQQEIATGEIIADKMVAVVFSNVYVGVTGAINITLNVAGDDVDPEQVFPVTITLSDPLSDTYGDVAFENGVAELEMTAGQKVTIVKLPPGVTYTVEAAPVEGYDTIYQGATGVTSNATPCNVVITNVPSTTGSLVVESVIEGDASDVPAVFAFNVELSDELSGTYGDMEFTDGVATFDISGEGSVTAFALPEDTGYRVTMEPNNNFETTATDASGTIVAGQMDTATFTNRVLEADEPVGSLLIQTVFDGDDDNLTLPLTVMFSDENLTGTYGDVTLANGIGQFSLEANAQVSISGIPAGTSYVTGVTNPEGFETVLLNGEGTIGDRTTINVTCTLIDLAQTGSLTITNTVADQAPEDPFIFTLTLEGTPINGVLDGLTFVDGVTSFALYAGESCTIKGLPAGLTYTVTVVAPNGYTTTSTDATGTIEANETVSVVFISAPASGGNSNGSGSGGSNSGNGNGTGNGSGNGGSSNGNGGGVGSDSGSGGSGNGNGNSSGGNNGNQNGDGNPPDASGPGDKGNGSDTNGGTSGADDGKGNPNDGKDNSISSSTSKKSTVSSVAKTGDNLPVAISAAIAVLALAAAICSALIYRSRYFE